MLNHVLSKRNRFPTSYYSRLGYLVYYFPKPNHFPIENLFFAPEESAAFAGTGLGLAAGSRLGQNSEQFVPTLQKMRLLENNL